MVIIRKFTNTYLKVMRQIYQNLVISVFLVLTFLSCASISQKANNEHLKVINLEIDSHKEFSLSDTVLFSYIPNAYLIENIKSQSELSKYLTDEDKHYFLELLNSKEKPIHNHKLPDNFYLEEDLQLNEVEKFKVKKVSVSAPVFSKKLDFVLIAYAYGVKNSMQGGIKKYNLIQNKWVLDQSFDLWIE